MEPSSPLIAVLFGHVVLTAVAAWIASSRGRNFYSTLALGLLFSPAVLVAAMLAAGPRAKTLA